MGINITEFQKLTEIIEKLGWSYIYDTDDDTIELEQYTREGEDFCFNVDAKNVEDFVKNVYQYYEDFDESEHAANWYGVGRGEPSNLRDLLDDAVFIKNNMLKPLADALWRFYYNKSESDGSRLDPDDKNSIQDYYEQNYNMDHNYAVLLTAKVIGYAFSMIKDREERMDFLDYVLEDFKHNSREG